MFPRVPSSKVNEWNGELNAGMSRSVITLYIMFICLFHTFIVIEVLTSAMCVCSVLLRPP
jgi:hypothetical protein